VRKVYHQISEKPQKRKAEDEEEFIEFLCFNIVNCHVTGMKYDETFGLTARRHILLL
jgi:hypothetical protein